MADDEIMKTGARDAASCAYLINYNQPSPSYQVSTTHNLKTRRDFFSLLSKASRVLFTHKNGRSAGEQMGDAGEL